VEQFVKGKAELVGVVGGELVVERDAGEVGLGPSHHHQVIGVDAGEQLFGLSAFDFGRI